MKKLSVFTLLLLLTVSSASPVIRPSFWEQNDGPFVITADVQSQEEVNYRLSGDVVPSKYEVKLTPNLDDWTFKGHVIIHVQSTVENVREITLHANYLNIESIKVYNPETPLVDLYEDQEYTYDNVTHKLTIPTNTFLVMATTYYVEMSYSGEISEEMTGFYRSTYMENGVEKRLAATQFEAISARKAFPCFDEPKFKAVFELKFLRTSQYNTLANTNRTATGVVQENGLLLDTYEPSPIMSSYLVAFIVSEFTGREDDQFGVWARPAMYEYSQYSFEVGAKILNTLSLYTDYSYYNQISKMDMAAIPDFSAGAMENWGLLTYREGALLTSADKTTSKSRQSVANVIAHEQAHMWFGDLVTCDWWQYAWLNEGFATFYSYYATGQVETTWEMDLQFVPDVLQVALQTDSNNISRSMNSEVNTYAEISGKFDSIAYSKGASILRMIESVMGADKFKAGIQLYLKENALSTGIPSKLYSALQTQAADGIDIASIMGSWADQEGFPVLTVEMNEERTSAKLSQRRFHHAYPTHTDAKIYSIPVTFATPIKGFENTTHSMLLTTKEGELEIPNGDSWVIFNTKHMGFYRVNYDEASWHLIHKALVDNHDQIHVLNRAQIVEDALNLARSDLLDYQMAFDILDYLPSETHYVPWLSAINGLTYLSRRLAGAHSALFGEYVKNTFQGIYEHLGFTPKATKSQTDIYNRANVLQWLCKYNHADCVANAKAEFAKAQEDDSYLVPVDIRQVVYCTGARHGDKATYEWLWNKYLNEDMSSEKNLLLNSMGCVEDEEVLGIHLGNIFTTAVRKQDKSSSFVATYSSHDENVSKILTFIRNNHAKIVEDLGSYGTLASYIYELPFRFTSVDQLNTFTAFVNEQSELFGSSDATLRTAVRNGEYMLHWNAEHVSSLVAIIDEKVNGGAAAPISLGLFFVLACAVLANVLF